MLGQERLGLAIGGGSAGWVGRVVVEHAEDRFNFDGLFAIVQFNHDARQPLLSKWHEHAAADHGSGFSADTVGKYHVERHGQGNVAEFRH